MKNTFLLLAAITTPLCAINAQNTVETTTQTTNQTTKAPQAVQKSVKVKSAPVKAKTPSLTEEQNKALNEKVKARFAEEKLPIYQKITKDFQTKVNAIKTSGKKLSEEEKRSIQAEFTKSKRNAGRKLRAKIKSEERALMLKSAPPKSEPTAAKPQ
jgi:hypothetical protein